MRDRISIAVGMLSLGTHYRDLGRKDRNLQGCDLLNWSDYEQTIQLLMEQPERKDLPLKPIWIEARRELGVSRSPSWSWPNALGRFQKMAASFALHGYKPELATGGETPIQLAIGDDGKICVIQGNKRVAFCRMRYGLDFIIDAEIARRSVWWNERREHFRRLGNGRLYQPIEHPDFDWPITQPCVERLRMIAPTGTGFMVDYGCHTGWFCRRFAELGWKATGIDHDPISIELARTLDPASTYVCHDILDASVIQADVALYLSLVMHTFRQDPERAWAHLKAVSEASPVLFLDCVWGGYAEHLPFTPETIAGEILKHTAYERFELLGRTAHENRPFYRFSR